MRKFPRVTTYARFFARLGEPRATAGKIALVTVLVGALVSVTTFWGYFQFAPSVHAAAVGTSLTVLNTPPSWTDEAHEDTPSATTTPTNAGDTLTFIGTGTDSSNDNYWLLICSASSTAVAHNNAPPTCGSGLMWARSATTTSGTPAVAATTTLATVPFANEINNWFGYICDGNSSGAQCNPVQENGTIGYPTRVSPFVINHPPIFSAIVNNSPQNPGASVTWTATSHDNDTTRGSDTVKLFVCKSNDFTSSSSTAACGAGGTWASSTLASTNPSTSTVLTIPFQDKTYNAFVYVVDQNNLQATSTFEASASNFVVNDVAPTISGSLVTVGPTSTDIILTTPHATSGPYKISFVVSDNNGCQNAASGNEIASASTSIFRSSVGVNSCQVSENTSSCYPSADPQTQITCVQDPSVNACNGPSDSDVGWTCTFNLWYNADPTDAGSQFAADNWLASVQAVDDNGLMSTATTSLTGNELDSFLAYNVSTSSIGYGGLQPGQKNDPLSQTTDLQEWGNTGLDENLYGDTMCTTWSGVDSCDTGGPDATRKIPVANQKFATSSVSYASGTSLNASTSPTLLGVHVQKTTSSSTVQTKNTFWGINVPGTITVSGNYQGQDSLIAAKSNSAFW